MRYILFSFVFCVCLRAFAIIAYPKKVNYTLPNGKTVFLSLHGDEFSKWATTEDEYTLLPDSLGWVYAKADATGHAIASAFRVCSLEDQSDSLRMFLLQTPVNLSVSINKEQLSKKRIINKTSSDKIAATGNRKALVILMAFKDFAFKKTYQNIYALFNQENYNEDGAIGSVHDYYESSSYGQLNLMCDVLGPYTASNNMSYYGGNVTGGYDRNPEALFQEAIQQASLEVNLADYDEDGDGYVDNVHIVFAGYGEEAGAASTAIWSHEATLNQPITIDGVKINGYSCAPELRGNSGSGLSRIGVHCHEIGHSLGAMDFYDTNYSTGGHYLGTGNWDIMASGSWNDDGISPADFNPYVKAYNFGWVNVQTLSNGKNRILSTNENKDQIYRLETPISGENYLLENRTQTRFNVSLPGSGLLIYHINKDIASSSSGNTINATCPQMCYPICASSTTTIPTISAASFGEINSAGCPFPGKSEKTLFGINTIPASFCWDGTEYDIALSDIVQNIDGSISLYSNTRSQDSDLAADTIYEENFEKVAPDVKQLQGSVNWKIYNNATDFQMSDGFTPAPYKGSGYLYMKQSTLLLSNTKSTSQVELNSLDLDPNSSYTIEFQYQNRGNKSGQPLLKFLYRTPIMADWQELATYNDLSSSWIKKEITLLNPNEQYKLAVQGDLYYGGLYIDNIKIYESTKTGLTSCKDDHYNLYIQNDQLYVDSPKCTELTWTNVLANLQGESLLSIGSNCIPLPRKGIYLITIGGKCYKIVNY